MSIEAMKQLRDVHEAQGRDGNWNHDHYMTGLFNGLELALSIMEGRDPNYREAIAEAEKQDVDWQQKWADEFAKRGAEVSALERKIAEAEKQEPVMRVSVEDGCWMKTIRQDLHQLSDGEHDLYTHPQPKREPLTDEQIAEAVGWVAGRGCKPLPIELQIARAIEAAHGIKE